MYAPNPRCCNVADHLCPKCRALAGPASTWNGRLVDMDLETLFPELRQQREEDVLPLPGPTVVTQQHDPYAGAPLTDGEGGDVLPLPTVWNK